MRRLALIATGVLLAGCSTLSDLATLGDDVLSPDKSSGVEVRSSDPRSGAVVTARTPPHDLNSVPKPKTKPRNIEQIDPKTLVGMTREQVKSLIGQPVTVNDRPPARVWSYRATGCALEVFFYLDVASKKFRALTYELRGAEGVEIAPNLCLGQIRAASYGS